MSQDAVGRAVGLSGSEVGRIERGEAPWLTVVAAVQLLRVVGLDLWAKTYPYGSPLRDRAHTELIQRFLGRLPPGVEWEREAPFAAEGDRRALDLLLRGLPVRTGVEAETRITDEQALLRTLNLKVRDARLGRIYLLVRRSRFNSGALEHAPALRHHFPLGTRTSLAALRALRDPGANGIIVL